jgi:Fe2+ transport system protein B
MLNIIIDILNNVDAHEQIRILSNNSHLQMATGVMTAVAIVSAVTGIASAISSGKAQKDALQMQFNQGQQQLRQEKELTEAQQKIDNKNVKLKILTDSVANIRSAQANAVISQTIASRQLAKDSEKRNVIIASVGGGIILIGALVVLKKTS